MESRNQIEKGLCSILHRFRRKYILPCGLHGFKHIDNASADILERLDQKPATVDLIQLINELINREADFLSLFFELSERVNLLLGVTVSTKLSIAHLNQRFKLVFISFGQLNGCFCLLLRRISDFRLRF